jgi:conjugative relaxase-like TrwC/TraI family protein
MACAEEAAKHAEKVVDASVDRWDSYVSELGRAGGEFMGGGAKALGLTGGSEDGATWSLMNGIHPVSGERFHRPYWTRVNIAKLRAKALAERKKPREPVPAYAAIFAAPKSVSLLLMTSVRDAVLEADRAAVAEAMRFRDSQSFVRDRSGSYPSLGVIAVSHEHHTARTEDPEPHLHTHVTVMNFAQRASDGKYLAVDYAHDLRIQKAEGILYQAVLRRELALRIPGIEFVLAENGTADIAQVPAEVREAFSTRQAQVMARERELAAEGITAGNRRKDLAGYQTRSRKKLVLNPREWMEQQREALAELGITDESIAAWAEQERTITPPSWEVRRQQLADQLFGPEGLTEKRNTFNRWDVMEQVGMAHYTDLEGFEQLVARTDELLADPRVLAVGEHGRYTVRELVELEEMVLEAHRQVLPRPAARSGLRAVVREIGAAEKAQGWEFNEGQRALIKGIASSTRHMDVVEALAGTGKTSSIGVIAEILEKHGVRVVGAGPTARARLELVESAGLREVYTLAKLKIELERGNMIFDRSRPMMLLIDEASFAATRELAPVLKAASAAGAHVVLVGDSGQLASVGAGGLFGTISRERQAHGMTVYKLDQVERHRTGDGKIDYDEVRVLAQLRDGHPEDWFALREKRGQLHIHTGRDAGVFGMEHAAILYLDALKRHSPEDLYLLSADNAVRAAVNERVREQLVEHGMIEEAGEIGGRKFANGERITLRKNDNDKDLANGMRATILNVDAKNGTLTVATDGKHGRVETLERDYVTGKTENGLEFVQGGYANTIHTSEGATAKESILVGPAQSLDKERGYVGGSRSTLATHVIAWDGSAPEYFAEHELTPQQQRQEVLDQLHDALTRSGTEQSATEQRAHAGDQLRLDFYDDTERSVDQPPASRIEALQSEPSIDQAVGRDNDLSAGVEDSVLADSTTEDETYERWRAADEEILGRIEDEPAAKNTSDYPLESSEQVAAQGVPETCLEIDASDEAVAAQTGEQEEKLEQEPTLPEQDVEEVRVEPGEVASDSSDIAVSGVQVAAGSAEPELPDPSRTIARDGYLAALAASRAATAELNTPLYKQVGEWQKLLDTVGEARRQADEQAQKRPAPWQSANRAIWKTDDASAQANLTAAVQRSQQARAALQASGTPEVLLQRYIKLHGERAALQQRASGLEKAALAEEVARQPDYLTQRIGPEPKPGQPTRGGWMNTARAVINDRWNRGIIHDEPVALSAKVERLAEQYLRQGQGLGEDQGTSIGM